MTPRFFSFLFLLITPFQYQAQNLVPNHSFEEFVDGCPVTFNGTVALGWESWSNTPDLYSTCVAPLNFNDSLGWIPWNGCGYQWPADGNNYMGLFAYEPNISGQNFREYIGCTLNEPLEIGETYYVSFKTSMAFGNYFYPTCASSHLGVYFTTQGYDAENNPLEIPNYAHVYEPIVISDTSNWTVVQGSFVADQVYSHMGLGVFYEYDQLETLNLGSMDICRSYYYIDDVCVSPISDCLQATSVTESEKLELVVFPNPAESAVYLKGSMSLTSVEIVDLSGAVVWHIDRLSTDRVTIDLSNISSGLYCLTAKYEKGFKREKLMVVH